MTTTDDNTSRLTDESHDNGHTREGSVSLSRVRRRAADIIQASRDLIDDIDVLLRQALNLSEGDSDKVFEDRASMMVVNYRQRGGE